MTIERVLELILGNLGVLFLLMFILVGGFRGWWVYGPLHKEMMRRADERAERAELRLDRAVGAAERGAVVADRATRVAERQLDPTEAGTNG